MSIHSAVFPGLFISNADSAKKYSELRSHGITGVAVIARGLRPPFPGSFRYLTVDLLDDGTDDLLVHLPRIFSFLDDVLNSQGKVLVHCQAGMSRSVSTVVAYLMRQWKLPFDLALEMFRDVYPSAAPAENFCEQLQVFEDAGFLLEDDAPPALEPLRVLQRSTEHQAMQEHHLGSDGKAEDESVEATGGDGEQEQQSTGKNVQLQDSFASGSDFGSGGASIAKGQGSDGFWQSALAGLHLQQGMSAAAAKEKVMATWGQASPLAPWRLYVQEWRAYTWRTVDVDIARELRKELVHETLTRNRGVQMPQSSGVCCCAKCHKALFSSQNLLHDCPGGYYVEPMQWMEASSSEGKLNCACGAKLGSYTWTGQSCGCKLWMVPAFNLQKKKVQWKELKKGFGGIEMPKPMFGECTECTDCTAV